MKTRSSAAMGHLKPSKSNCLRLPLDSLKLLMKKCYVKLEPLVATTKIEIIKEEVAPTSGILENSIVGPKLQQLVNLKPDLNKKPPCQKKRKSYPRRAKLQRNRYNFRERNVTSESREKTTIDAGKLTELKPRLRRNAAQTAVQNESQQVASIKCEEPDPAIPESAATVKVESELQTSPNASLYLWGTRHKLIKAKEVKRNVPCDLCGKMFPDRHYMLRHLSRHTGERPFKCPVCSKEFKLETEVTVHLRKHNGDRPYSCSVCGKKFSQKSHVVHHERIHTGSKPYKCTECGKRFTQQGILDNHRRQHFRDLPYTCRYCQKGFGYECYLNAHLRVHFGDTPFKCNYCGSCFRSRQSCQRHSKKCGNGNQEVEVQTELKLDIPS